MGMTMKIYMVYVAMIVIVLSLSLVGSLAYGAEPWTIGIVNLPRVEKEVVPMLQAAIARLNRRAGTTLVRFGNSDRKFHVAILVQNNQYFTARYQGTAHTSKYRCVVRLTYELFKHARQNHFKTVLWHELGHCAGFPHSKKTFDIMNPTPRSSWDGRPVCVRCEAEIKPFIDRLKKAVLGK